VRRLFLEAKLRRLFLEEKMFYIKDFSKDRIKAMFLVMLALDVFITAVTWLVFPKNAWKEIVPYIWAVVFLLMFAIWINDRMLLRKIKRSVQKSVTCHSKPILNAAEDLEKRFLRGNKGSDQIRILLRRVFFALAGGMDLSDIQEHYLERYGLSVQYRTAYPLIGRSYSVVGGTKIAAHGDLRLFWRGEYKGYLRVWNL
jgi:hypothetical protein